MGNGISTSIGLSLAFSIRNLLCLHKPSFVDHDKGSQHLRKVLLSHVDRATCVRTYQVIYFIRLLSLKQKYIHVLGDFHLPPLRPSMQTYKPLRNGIIDSQLCAGEAEGNKVEENAYCYAFH